MRLSMTVPANYRVSVRDNGDGTKEVTVEPPGFGAVTSTPLGQVGCLGGVQYGPVRGYSSAAIQFERSRACPMKTHVEVFLTTAK
jgi:hypothetical protein